MTGRRPDGEWHLCPPNPLDALTPGCQTWQRDVRDGHLTVVVGREREGWHLSISHRTNTHPSRPGRNPKWSEIKDARYRFLPAGINVAMMLPPPEEYVNAMDTCFHLWECTCNR